MSKQPWLPHVMLRSVLQGGGDGGGGVDGGGVDGGGGVGGGGCEGGGDM